MCDRVTSLDYLPLLPTHPLLSLWSSGRVAVLVKVHLACSLVTLVFAMMPATSTGQDSVNITQDIFQIIFHNFSSAAVPGFIRLNLTEPAPGASAPESNAGSVHNGNGEPVEEDIPREYPTALVIASSVAAVTILVFFFLAYYWHTHQLDSRARKLAIRLAADAEQGARRRNCPAPQQARGHSRAPSVSEASTNRNHYEALAMEDDLGQYSDCGRSSRGVSESDAGDSEDAFGPSHLPGIGEHGRGLAKGVRGGHRKWNRSRKHSSGANLDKRDSAVTDKEILTHFASRRHSTFFI